MPRRRHRPDGRQLTGRQARDREFRDDEPVDPQVEPLQQFRVELADDAVECRAVGSVDPDPRRPARVEHGFGPLGAIGRPTEAEQAAQQFDQTLRVVEVVVAARPIPRRRFGRPRQGEPEAPPLPRRVPIATVSATDLEDGDVLAAVAQVRRDDRDEAPDEILAKDRVITRQRVRDAHDLQGGMDNRRFRW